jgi:hypothetical protein
MPVKHCCYGDCNSDSRYVGKRSDMDGVNFFPFPKPKTQLEKCRCWVRLCGRKYFTVESIRKDTYICSKHFVGGNGPTDAQPDPLPAVSTDFERNMLSAKKKRKPPTPRPLPQKRRRKCLTDQEETPTCSDSKTESSIVGLIANEHDYACLTATDIHVDHEPVVGLQFTESEDVWCDAVSEVPCLAGKHIILLTLYIYITVILFVTLDAEIINLECYPVGEEEVCINSQTTSADVQVQTEHVLMSEVGIQTDICLQHIQQYEDDDLTNRNQMSRTLFMSSVLKDSNSCKFYTGMSIAVADLEGADPPITLFTRNLPSNITIIFTITFYFRIEFVHLLVYI